MKRRISVGAVVVTLAILFILSASKAGKPQPMTVVAVGFTNNVRGDAEALFLLSNASRDVSWNIYSLQQKTDGGWSIMLPPTPMTPASIYPSSAGCVFGVLVSSTTNLWRVVLYCRERRRGELGLLDRSKEMYEKYFTRRVTMRHSPYRPITMAENTTLQTTLPHNA